MGHSAVRQRALVVCAVLACAAADCGEPQGPISSVDAGDGPGYDSVPLVVTMAGADLHVLEGSRVQLDGHGSRSLVVGQPIALTWSQVDGPPVVLTNPSGPSPAFVAPLSPAELRFRLRGEAGGQFAFDELTVVVSDNVGAVPFFVELGPDRVAEPGAEVSVRLELVGTPAGDVLFEAEARCLGTPATFVAADTVSLVLPTELPCVLHVDAVDEQGRRSGTSTLTFFPQQTELPIGTRVLAPVVAEPSTEIELTFEGGGSLATQPTRAWPAGGRGDGLASAQPGPAVTLQSPARRTRMVVGAERRLGPASGGVTYTFVDVSAGFGNRAPVASGGADRRVRPGASFTLTTSGSLDLDDDPLVISIVQVIGPAAGQDEVQPGVLHAPDTAGTLAFHVTASDGIVSSEPDSVRVVIDPATENDAPVIEIEPLRYVAPGRTFTLDASGAYDPDSGFLERFQISQSQDDEALLLSEPMELAVVELVAGADGDVYNFRLTAFDEAGLAGSADVQVIVEEAGPYVDATLGDDETGNGTAAAPFASLEAAVAVARRHQLAELRLGAGPQQPFGGRIDQQLTVRGGFEWDGSVWIEGAQRSELPVDAMGLTLANATISNVDIELSAAASIVTIEGRSALLSVSLVQAPAHTGTFIDVAPAAIVALDGVDVTATSIASGQSTLLSAREGAAVRLTDAVFTGGPGGHRTALRCEGAFMDAIRTVVIGATGAETAVAIDAVDCDMQLLASDISGGTATVSATGVRVTDTVLFVGPGSTLTGASLGAVSVATGVVAGGTDAPVAIAGSIFAVSANASALRAVGLEALSSRVSLSLADVSAVGAEEAVGVRAGADRVQLASSTVSAQSPGGLAVAVELDDGVEDVSLSAMTLSASGTRAIGVASGDTSAVAPTFDDVDIDATGVDEAAGFSLHAASQVSLARCSATVSATGVNSTATALSLGDGRVEDCTLSASSAAGAVGVLQAGGSGQLLLIRTDAQANSSSADAAGALAGAPLLVSSSVLSASGLTSGVALDALSDVTLRHATLLGSTMGMRAESSSAMLDLANSVFVATAGLLLGTQSPMPTLARTLAFASEVALTAGDNTQLRTTEELEDAGCVNCRVVVDALLDERGRIIPDASHPLIDQADPGFTLPWDVDGDERPQGLAPDIGADELVEP